MGTLQLKGGSATQVAAYTPADREVVIDTTNYKLVIGDGATVGGNPLVVNASSSISADKWTTARNLSFTGAATGSGSIDGSANVSIALSIGDLDMGALS